MEWKNNFSEINLIFNTPITFSLYEDDNNLVPIYEFQMRIPTVEEVHTDESLMTIVGILNTDIDDLQKQFPMIQNLSTHFGLFNTLLVFGEKNIKLYSYAKRLLKSFNKLNIPISISNTGIFYTIDNYQVTYDIFLQIQQILIISVGLKNANDLAINDPYYLELQKKIKKIKQNGTKNQNSNNHSLWESIVMLTYEFGFNIDEIKNMNVFQMNSYLKYVKKSVQHKVSLIAYGNGLTKKLKYITDKGS